MDKNLVIFGCFILSLLIVPAITLAVPPPSSEFYGYVIVDGKLARSNTTVEVFDITGTPCGLFIVSEKGRYGYLSCGGDDPSTSSDEGPSSHENVYFNIDGRLAVSFGDVGWSSGSVKRVDLVVGDLKRSVPVTGEEAPDPVNQFLFSLLLILLISPVYYILINLIQNEFK